MRPRQRKTEGDSLTGAEPSDKQLRHLAVKHVIDKRRLNQALNAKEFAVLVGISYSIAREWFKLEGFPVFRGVVFWQDFVEWRRAKIGLIPSPKPSGNAAPPSPNASSSERAGLWTGRAARILAEAGK